MMGYILKGYGIKKKTANLGVELFWILKPEEISKKQFSLYQDAMAIQKQ